MSTTVSFHLDSEAFQPFMIDTTLGCLQVDICDGKAESLCLSETEIVNHSDSSDSLERPKLTPPVAKPRPQGEMLLHPDLASKTMETSLNLPEIIGRKEKLV